MYHSILMAMWTLRESDMIIPSKLIEKVDSQTKSVKN